MSDPRPPKRKSPVTVTKIALGVVMGLILFSACSVALIAATVDKAVDSGTHVVASAMASPAAEDSLDPAVNADYTKAQENAIESAQNYVDMSGFSKAGLMRQLTSDAGEGYNKNDAEFAIKHINVDWNAEAVESAQAYLDMTAFSRSGLIEQLHSKAGDGYTLKQATYAVKKVGL